MPRVVPEKKEVCPACERKFRSVAQHLSSPFTSCRPWYGDLISITELLAERNPLPSTRPSPSPTPSLVQSDLAPFTVDDLYPHEPTDLMDFEAGDNMTSSPGPEDHITADNPKMKRGYHATMHPNTPIVKAGGETFIDKFDQDRFAEERKQNLYYPFADRDDWEVGYWLLNSGLSMAAINKFLSLRLVSGSIKFALGGINTLEL